MASLLAQLVSFLYCWSAIARIEYVSLTEQNLCFDFYKIRTMLLFGIPISFQYVFRNVLQALGVAIWSLMSGFAELTARILMSKCFVGYIGADVLFLSEPASWLGAMLCVFLPYFYYRRKLLR